MNLGLRAAWRLTLALSVGCSVGCAEHDGEPAQSAPRDGGSDKRVDSNSDVDEDAATPDDDAQSDAAVDAGISAQQDAQQAAAVDAATPRPPRSGVNTESARVTQVVADFCKVAFDCNAGDARNVFTSEPRCRTDMQRLFAIALELDGVDCADSQLDLHACYANASCDDQFTACVAGEEESTELCPQSF